VALGRCWPKTAQAQGSFALVERGFATVAQVFLATNPLLAAMDGSVGPIANRLAER